MSDALKRISDKVRHVKMITGEKVPQDCIRLSLNEYNVIKSYLGEKYSPQVWFIGVILELIVVSFTAVFATLVFFLFIVIAPKHMPTSAVMISSLLFGTLAYLSCYMYWRSINAKKYSTFTFYKASKTLKPKLQRWKRENKTVRYYTESGDTNRKEKGTKK